MTRQKTTVPLVLAVLALASCSGAEVASSSDGGRRDSGGLTPECKVDQDCVAGRCVTGTCMLDGPDASSSVPPDASAFMIPADGGTSLEPDSGVVLPCDDGADAGAGPFTFNPSSRPSSGTLKASDLQDAASSKHPSPSSTVRVWGVVSTTPKVLLSAPSNSVSCFYGAWVSDPAGGANSGLLVVAFGTSRTSSSAPCTGGGAIPDSLKPGDAWDISGQYTEYCYKASGSTTCSDPETVTELRATTMTRLGNAPVPAAEVLQAASVGDNAAENASHDGVLIQVRDVAVTNTNPDAPSFFGNFEVDSHLYVNDQFRYTYKPVQNDRIRCLTGVLYYSFGHHTMLPRSDRDIVR